MAQLNSQQQQPVTRAEAQSAFKAKADELLKSEKIDKDVMPVMLDLIEAMEKDLTAKQRTEALASAQEAQTKAIHSELGRMVERYAKASSDPELIRALQPKIVQEAISNYNANPKLVNQYQSSGEVNWSEFDKFVVAEVTKWDKNAEKAGDKKPAAGGPAMTNSAPAGVTQPSQSLSVDDLNERQREMFHSQVSFGKQNGLTREKAQERALSLIKNAEDKIKSSKR